MRGFISFEILIASVLLLSVVSQFVTLSCVMSDSLRETILQVEAASRYAAWQAWRGVGLTEKISVPRLWSENNNNIFHSFLPQVHGADLEINWRYMGHQARFP